MLHFFWDALYTTPVRDIGIRAKSQCPYLYQLIGAALTKVSKLKPAPPVQPIFLTRHNCMVALPAMPAERAITKGYNEATCLK